MEMGGEITGEVRMGVNVRQDRDGKISVDTSEHDKKSRGYYRR